MSTVDLTFVGGLILGVPTSLHCVGMCGPMAAFFLDAPKAAIGYHIARTLGYTALGAVLGAVGEALGLARFIHHGAWLSVALGVALLLFAAGLDKQLGRLPGAGGLVARIVGKTRALPPYARAATIGLVTPLLPCGPLYAAYLLAAATGHSIGGARFMLGFALGLLPLLAAAQFALPWFMQKLGRRWVQRGFRVLMALAALVLIWRGMTDITSDTEAPACPYCEPQDG